MTKIEKLENDVVEKASTIEEQKKLIEFYKKEIEGYSEKLHSYQKKNENSHNEITILRKTVDDLQKLTGENTINSNNYERIEKEKIKLEQIINELTKQINFHEKEKDKKNKQSFITFKENLNQTEKNAFGFLNYKESLSKLVNFLKKKDEKNKIIENNYEECSKEKDFENKKSLRKLLLERRRASGSSIQNMYVQDNLKENKERKKYLVNELLNHDKKFKEKSEKRKEDTQFLARSIKKNEEGEKNSIFHKKVYKKDY